MKTVKKIISPDQAQLRDSLKKLVNDLVSKHHNINDLLSNNNVSLADVVFQTYDTKLAQSYFSFLVKVKSYRNQDKKPIPFVSKNLSTREVLF